MFQWHTPRDLLQIPWSYVSFLLVSVGLEQVSEGLNSCLLLLFYSQSKYFCAGHFTGWSFLESCMCHCSLFCISVQCSAFFLTSNPDWSHDCSKFNIEIFFLHTFKESCHILHVLSFNILMIDFFIFLATISKTQYSRACILLLPWKDFCWTLLHI